jgi:hypothetical protein
MSQLFLAQNLIKEADLTPSSENAQYPLSNLLDDRRSKVFRSTDNNLNIVIDLGTQRDINIVALVDSGLDTFGFNSATIELNNSDTWVTPIYSSAISMDVTFGFAYHQLPSTYNIRYVRLVFSNTIGYCEISKIFIGESADIGDLCFNYPIQYKAAANKKVEKNRLGQKFIDEINTQKELSGSISTMTKEEAEPLMGLLDYASSTRPIWIIFPEGNITDNNNRLNGYYYLTDEPSWSFVVGNYWNISLDFEEGT